VGTSTSRRESEIARGLDVFKKFYFLQGSNPLFSRACIRVRIGYCLYPPPFNIVIYKRIFPWAHSGLNIPWLLEEEVNIPNDLR
jgi:hypothetical protein